MVTVYRTFFMAAAILLFKFFLWKENSETQFFLLVGFMACMVCGLIANLLSSEDGKTALVIIVVGYIIANPMIIGLVLFLLYMSIHTWL